MRNTGSKTQDTITNKSIGNAFEDEFADSYLNTGFGYTAFNRTPLVNQQTL